MTARFSEAESPQAHLRNALQILAGGERAEDGIVTFSARDVDAIESRLFRATRQLEERLHVLPITPAVVSDLQAMVTMVASQMRCVVCGCDEMHACSIDPRAMTEEDRAAVVEYYVERSELLPDRVPCSWAQQNPAVCTNPDCRRKYAEATA